MARIPRLTLTGEPAVYHVISRTALDGFVLGFGEDDNRVKFFHLPYDEYDKALVHNAVGFNPINYDFIAIDVPEEIL